MASYTTNLNLKKPAGSENVAIGDINNNMDTIDQAVGTLNTKITHVDSGSDNTYGNVTWYKNNRFVFVYINVSSVTGAASSFTQIASGLPIPIIGPVINGVNGAGNGNVTLYVDGGGNLKMYGRGSETTCTCAITYLSAS